MKIGINGRLLMQPYTGIGQFTRGLFINLAKIDKKNEYILVSHKRVDKKTRDLFPKNVKIKILAEKKFPSKGVSKTWWEQQSLPRLFLKEGVDLAIFPYAANFWSKKYQKKFKSIVAVHDCIPWENKDYRKKILSKMYHSRSKNSLNKADKIVAVSKFSKNRIVKVCGIDAGKIEVIPNDAAEIYKKPVKKSVEAKMLKKHSLKSGEFFLYCGGFDKRKNIEMLIEEYEVFSKGSRKKMPLVLAGGKLFENELYESFDKKADTKGQIIKTGFLGYDELKALYKNCCAFVHLSKEEGFNIPVLEAANCGAPLVLSNIAVHKEVAGDKAMFVSIKKHGECAKALKKISNKKTRAIYHKKALELAKEYSWKDSAKLMKKLVFSLSDR